VISIRTLFVSSALVVMVVFSTSAQAGPVTTVNFRTTGVFTGCASLGGDGTTFASCTMGMATLRYNFNGTAGSPDSKVLTNGVPTAVQYGGFTMSDGATLSNFNGTNFTLNLVQSSPSVGTQPVVGALSGTVQVQSGVLLWGPVSPTSWSIGQVNWTLNVDPVTQGIRIDPPGDGGTPGPTQTMLGSASLLSNAVPNAVPEPSTFALMAAGFAAVVARRRRSAK